ncbi:MAG: PilN domain-containing protein [Hyphomicrobiaceae bacterium]
MDRSRRNDATRHFVAAIAGGNVRWLAEDNGHIEEIERRSASLEPSDAFKERLTELLNKNAAMIGIRLDKSACLERKIVLPTNARDRFRSIIDLDIERTTPFKLGEIYSAFVDDDTRTLSRDKTALRLFIVKRDYIDPHIQTLTAMGLPPSFVDCWDEAGVHPIELDFLAASAVHDHPPQTPIRVEASLVAVAALLALFAGASYFWKVSSASADLRNKVEQARAHHQTLRASIAQQESQLEIANEIQNFTRRGPRPELILQELTHLLPDGTYLTDLELSDDKIRIVRRRML